MTVAVSLKVHEGLVLAADSASTLTASYKDGSSTVINVYDNANKIVNLVKGLPLGVVTWGAGAIGPESITTLYKDLRRMLTGQSVCPDGTSWQLDPQNYEVKDVAEKVRHFLYDVKYRPEYGELPAGPELGMIIAGYSAGGTHPEEYLVQMNSECEPPELLRPGAEGGYFVGGQPEAVARLVDGAAPDLARVFVERLNVPPPEATAADQIIRDELRATVIFDPMPFKDALDLAEFFVDLTCKFSRFTPGAATVGGPIELAGITKHEGFKWVKRKHYYREDLNPREGLHS